MLESEKRRLDLATKRGYLLLESKHGQRVKNAYFNWCTENQKVFVCVRKSMNTSIIELDFFPVASQYKFFTKDACERYVEIAMKYLDPYKDDGYLFQYIKHIPNYEVDIVLENLLELIAYGLEESYNENYSVGDIIKQVALSVQHKRVNTGKRNPKVSKAAKEYAQGVCDLCNKSAPFKDRNGVPYLEAHHIVWLSRGGYDVEENIAALCPNCHRKMHILDSVEDRAYLKEKAVRHFNEKII